MSFDPTNDRKLEHIRILENDRETERAMGHFDRMRLIHRALPEIALDEVDPSTTFLGKKLSFPLLISSMTGGDHELVRRVNRNLAEAAEECGVAMGVGSQRVMFTHPDARASFALREHAPTALLFANLGAVQLNLGFGADQCREAVDVLGADALYLHLNPLQEAVQPEGDTDFRGLSDRIADIVKTLPVPVVLKEVGAGMSPADVALAHAAGVRHIDVAGAGGTSWSRIESHRHASPAARTLGMLFQDWGLPTPDALRLLKPWRDRVDLIASGGIRSGVDMAKAVILGARLCGMAAPFLRPAMDSSDAVASLIRKIEREFRTAMFLLGVAEVDSLHGNEALVLTP